MKYRHGLMIITAGFLSLSPIGCKEEPAGPAKTDCSFTGGKPVSLVSPVNGSRYKTGDTVDIKFKVDRNLLQMVHTQVTHGEGIDFSDIASEALPVPQGDQFQCMSQKWVVGRGQDTLTYATPDTALIWIHQYGSYTTGVLFDNVKIIINGN